MSRNEKETIAAVVVTYNRKDLLKECLNALLNQTRKPDSIIIMDNASTDGTQEMLKKEFLKKKIFDYVRLKTNTGGAGGFHYGMKRAYEKGFDWIWVMDDDAIPEKNCLSILIKNTNYSDVLAPIKISDEGHIQFNHFGFISFFFKRMKMLKRLPKRKKTRIDFSSFVGPLFNKETIKLIGLPKKELFIWEDDFEYCLRIKNKKIKVLLIPEAKIIHKDKQNQGGVSFSWKNYYGWRNKIYIRRTYLSTTLFFVYLTLFSIYILLKILIYSRDKNKYISLYLFAVKRGIKRDLASPVVNLQKVYPI